MDDNKIKRTLSPAEVIPVVSHATYATVPKGACWGERAIPDVELILIVAGRFRYEPRGGAALELKAGHVLLIPPAEPHILRRLDDPSHAAFSCLHLELLPDCRWSEGIYQPNPTHQRVTLVESWAFHDLFMRCSEVFLGYDHYRETLLETLAKELWIRLSEIWSGGGAGGLVPERIRTMVAYLRQNLTDPAIGRHDLARVFHITPEHVNALFRSTLGVTPTQFLHRERVLRAYRYIRDENCSVKEAASRVGFDDPFYFSRIFRRVLHYPPSALHQQPPP